jgi:hypothetical protein
MPSADQFMLIYVMGHPAACIISARVPNCCLGGVPSSSGANQSHRASCLENKESVPEFSIATVPKNLSAVLPHGSVHCAV